MKKLYFTFFALVISTMTFAQTTMLSEGFEGVQFPPSGWTRETINMSMYTWFRGAALYTTDWWGNQYHVVPPEGMRMAALESDLNEEWGPQDESLITPIIAVEHPAVLTFETFCQYGHPEYRDHYEVDVLDATGSWNTLWDGAEQPTVWLNQFEEPVSIDLSPYQGQSIKIRFRGYNDAGEVLTYSWFIDNVKVIATDTIPDSVNETALQASIYPNPTDHMVNIKAANVIQLVSIFNLLGVKVKEFVVNDMEAVIDLSELNAGMYLVQLWSDKNQPYIKIINKL